MLPSLQNIDGKVKNVIGTTLSARYPDKQFLNELTKDDWKNVIDSLQTILTDEKITDAVKACQTLYLKFREKSLLKN